MSRLAKHDGFTLIEIIVVVIILGLLVGLVGPQIVGRVGESKVETARAQIEMLAAAEIAAWLDTFDFSESGGPGYTEELVVNLALSEETAALVRTLVQRWMDESISMEQMNREIQELIRAS